VPDSHLDLPFAAPGVSVFVRHGDPSDQPHVLFAKVMLVAQPGATPVRVHDLEDLAGHVVIANERDALLYVRLQSTPYTCHLLHGDVEVVPYSAAFHLPNYGLHGGFGWGKDMSGYLGVLSDAAFAQGHFAAPSVTSTREGFAVVRWLYAGRRVQLVRETVRKDGWYGRTVLRDEVPPQLPGTKWEFPSIE